MSYELTYSETALKQLKKLEKATQQRIIATLERCRVRPHDHLKKIIGTPYFRFRVGDYRVLVRIINDEVRILVIKMGHRSHVYE